MSLLDNIKETESTQSVRITNSDDFQSHGDDLEITSKEISESGMNKALDFIDEKDESFIDAKLFIYEEDEYNPELSLKEMFWYGDLTKEQLAEFIQKFGSYPGETIYKYDKDTGEMALRARFR